MGAREEKHLQQDLTTLQVLEAVIALRRAFGYRPFDPFPEADVPEHWPATAIATSVDMGGWIAWAVAGLFLFSGGGFPTSLQATTAARQVVTILALRRSGGNTTHAATALETSRRVVREILRALGLHPWTPARDRDDAKTPLGTRVIAIAREEARTVYVYGWGRYVGKTRPPTGTRTRHLGIVSATWPPTLTSPCIELEDGGMIWGVECVWLTEAEFETRHGAKHVRFVPRPTVVTTPTEV